MKWKELGGSDRTSTARKSPALVLSLDTLSNFHSSFIFLQEHSCVTFSYPWRRVRRQWFHRCVSSCSVSAQQNMTEQMNQLSVPVAAPSLGGPLRNWDGLISSKVGLTENSQWGWSEKSPRNVKTPRLTVHLCIVPRFDWFWLVSRQFGGFNLCSGTNNKRVGVGLAPEETDSRNGLTRQQQSGDTICITM